ncbi:hypothetical protein ACR03S_13230 [Limimaricola variabilis]
MNSKDAMQRPLDDLATTAIQLGRDLERSARAVCLGGSSKGQGFVDRTLRHLAERDPFDQRFDVSLEALRSTVEAELASEVLHTERRFIATRFDAEGQHGEVYDCPVYSDRGQDLLVVQTTYLRFIAARDATLDRIAAERALRRLLTM